MPASPPLKVLVFGAGAIGSYAGGSLALNHQEVVFLDRPAIIERLRSQGLKIIFPTGKKHPDQNTTFWLEPSAFEAVPSVEAALALSPFDIAIFALKSYDTAAALSSLETYRALLPPFLCLQNGVENEIALASVLGAGNVIAGSVTSAIGRGSSGEVVVERQRGIGIAGDHPLSGRLVKEFLSSGIQARLFSQPLAMKWSKLFTNLVANASAAILGMSPGEIFAHPSLFKMEMSQLRECLAVMAALKIPVVDLPGTPVRALAFAVKVLPDSLARPVLLKAVGGGRGGKMPSLYLDLKAGKPESEVEYLNGAVVRYGEKAGVRTPVNRFLRDTLISQVKGELDPLRFAGQPLKLLAALDRSDYSTVP